MDDMTMGQRIAAERKKLGISQEQLGEKTGVSRQAISKWEADGAIPEIDKLITLSRLFGVSVGWLLGVESHPKTHSDELSENQLKIVEEIVKRNQPKSLRNIPLYNFLVVLVGVIGFASIFFVSTLKKPVPDYSAQIAKLESSYSGIQTQLSALSGRISSMSASIEEENSTLSGYRFYLEPNNEEKTVTVSIEAIPKMWNAETTAMLYVRLDGAQYANAAFQWDGSAYIVSADVAYHDGYEYWMVLETPEGTQESVQLYDTVAQYPRREYAITCEVTVGTSRYLKAQNHLATSGFEAHVRLPDSFALSLREDVSWEYAEWMLYHIRGPQREIAFSEPLFYIYGNDDAFTEAWFYLNKELPLPELQDGDGLELWCRAGLTNGLSASTLACSWACVNGELIQSVPANVAEKVN